MTMLEKSLNILMLEDMKTDAELIKRQVLKIAPQAVITIARNRAEFFEKIEWSVPDIVLADYNLPDFNGLEALLHIRKKKPMLPFIFITGILNDEEKVAEAILNGASGYVLKENLSTLALKMEEVFLKSEAQLTVATADERRWREAELNLQKVQSKLLKVAEFEGKAEIMLLLTNVLDAIQE
jgi:CheY-like chemotaxis protein